MLAAGIGQHVAVELRSFKEFELHLPHSPGPVQIKSQSDETALAGEQQQQRLAGELQAAIKRERYLQACLHVAKAALSQLRCQLSSQQTPPNKPQTAVPMPQMLLGGGGAQPEPCDGSDATAAAAGQAAGAQLLPWQPSTAGLLFEAADLQCELDMGHWQQQQLQHYIMAPQKAQLAPAEKEVQALVAGACAAGKPLQKKPTFLAMMRERDEAVAKFQEALARNAALARQLLTAQQPAGVPPPPVVDGTK